MIDHPGQLDIEIWQGATFRRTVTWYNDEAATVPVDLTGAIGRASIRRSARSLDPEATFTVTTGGVTGEIEIELSAADTTALESWGGVGAWDLEIEWPNGDVDRLLYGNVHLKPEVTR